MLTLAKFAATARDETDLDREGRHPFFGPSALEKLLKLVYRHNMLHLRDIRHALKERDSGQGRRDPSGKDGLLSGAA